MERLPFQRMLAALVLTIAAVAGPAAQIDPRAALLERGAWEALNAGRVHEAAEAFREAIALDAKNARLRPRRRDGGDARTARRRCEG